MAATRTASAPRPKMNGAFRHDDVRRAVGHRADERIHQRGELERARMGGESMIRRDDEVGPIEEPLRLQRVLDAPDLRVDQRQCVARGAAPIPRV